MSSSSQNAQAKVNLDSYPKSLLRKQRNWVFPKDFPKLVRFVSFDSDILKTVREI